MRFKDMPRAEARSGDCTDMREAIVRLLEVGVDARRPPKNKHQIKVSSDLSFYPTTGAIVPDGMPALPERGIAALVNRLARNDLDLE